LRAATAINAWRILSHLVGMNSRRTCLVTFALTNQQFYAILSNNYITATNPPSGGVLPVARPLMARAGPPITRRTFVNTIHELITITPPPFAAKCRKTPQKNRLNNSIYDKLCPVSRMKVIPDGHVALLIFPTTCRQISTNTGSRLLTASTGPGGTISMSVE
jgi:hypothetical protein